MMNKSNNPASLTESMLFIGVGLGALYWIIQSLMYIFMSNEPGLIHSLRVLDIQRIWQPLVVLCLFVFFGSHVQYTIRKRKKAEDALRESEHRYRELVENSTDTIISVNENMQIIQWNKAASELFGFPKELVMGKKVDILIPQKYKQKHIDGMKKFLESGESQVIGKTIELEGLLRNGTTRPIELSLSGLKKNGSWVFTGIIRETTERRRALEALRESEERYRNLFEDSRDAIMIWTQDGKLLAVNQSTLDTFGYTIEEMIGSDISQIYVHPGDLSEFQQKLEQEDAVRGYEVELRKKDGTEMDCLLTATVRRGKEGRVLGYQGIARDVTVQKRNENELKRTLETLRKAMGATIQAMSLTLENRDPYTAGHQRRVGDLARAIAQEMGLTQDQVDGIRMSGLIHDLGKIAVPAEILTKPSKLTKKEFEIIKDHPQVGYEILNGIEFPWPVSQIILQHHERMDGSGYPKGISGGEILLEARIMAVADVVEAMASHRPYRPALGIDMALEEISQKRGGAYDPAVVDACLKIFKEKKYTIE